VRGSRFVAFGVLLVVLILANYAFADGDYQRTDDRRKTLVWNNNPQPGDAATWSGGRDSESYAEGQGTLTWLRTQKQFQTGSNIAGSKKIPISRYTGIMVRGKFDGAVTTVDHGKTYHAKFVNGQRKGSWMVGPVVAKESIESRPTTKKRHEASSSVQAATPKKVELQQPKVAEETAVDVPAEGPAEENAEVKRQEAETTRSTAAESSSRSTLNEGQSNAGAARTSDQPSTPLLAQVSEGPDESATPQKPVTKKAALAPGAVRAIDEPARRVTEKTESTRAKVKETQEKAAKPPKIAKPEAAEEKVESPAEGPITKGAPSSSTPKNVETSEISHPSSFIPPPSVKEGPVDDSIRTLTGPPSSLHVKPPAETSPAAPTSMPSTAPAAPPAAPKLNAVQAMDIADIEARTRGYDLGEYQLPKAEYNAANDTWSVSYIGRDSNKGGKHLSVIVQDKTGKAEVNK
jgi:hypothetical protein